MGRQVGSALGIAILVAVLGAGSATLADFQSAWLICSAGAVTAGLTLAALGAPARSPARVSAEAVMGEAVMAEASR
jgi:hypothetical protein